MAGEELRELETSIARAQKACRTLSILCSIATAAFNIVWLISLAAIANATINDPDSNALSYNTLLHAALNGIVINMILVLAIRFFKDPASGQPPFSAKQASRIRMAGFLILLLALFQAVFSLHYSFSSNILGLNTGATSAPNPDQPYIDINIAMIAFGVSLLGLSVMFQYGTLLQRLSDETA